jgi:hypothetical protein
MESNTQQHLMKMMTAYSQLKIELSNLKIELTKPHKEHDKQSSQVANLTLVEPVKLTDDNSSFTFNITSSQGWTSPPFSVLDGYTFSIAHREDKTASLMLLKGKYDDHFKWPMNLPYKLEIRIQEPHKMTVQGRRALTTPRQIIRTVQLSDDLERVSTACSKETVGIDLPERELLNYVVVVRLVPVDLSPQVPTYVCPNCSTAQPVPSEFCQSCKFYITNVEN